MEWKWEVEVGDFVPFVVLRCGGCGAEVPKRGSHADMLREAVGRGWVLRGMRYLCGQCRKPGGGPMEDHELIEVARTIDSLLMEIGTLHQKDRCSKDLDKCHTCWLAERTRAFVKSLMDRRGA